MKRVAKVLALSLLSSAFTILIISACGGKSTPNPMSQAARFAFTWKPVHLLGRTSGIAIASTESPFVVNAQSTTPGGGNFSGFCNAVAPSSGRAATVLFGLGRWSSGSCDDAATPDSGVGVNIPQNGQVGQLTVDAVGLGTGSDSGAMELKLVHADGTETILPLTCTLGVSSAGSKVHCEDKTTAHNSNAVAGDQFVARIFYDAGDSYNAIRVNVQYATPTF
jgi:hypothetical protein